MNYLFFLLPVVTLVAYQSFSSYKSFRRNLAAAKQSGLPYLITPWYIFRPWWMIVQGVVLPYLKMLPKSWTGEYLEYLTPEFVWNKHYDSFRELGSDIFVVVSPGVNTLWVADPEAISQITSRRNDFPKPTWMYKSVDIYGKNVVSLEGQLWRHHRKITSPPFTEKNNQLVWKESLHQAQSMLAGWIAEDTKASGPIWNVESEAMRLSLHVISRAGFGERLQWPHEEAKESIPPGHTLSYKAAIETLLLNIVVVMLSPPWLLRNSPLKIHKVANEAFVEWGRYMREMYESKRNDIKDGRTREGMDLMGALVKGAGVTSEMLNAEPDASTSKQLLSDEEILGNAFVFILAGHETAANTIHFSIMFLAMHMTSQKRLQVDLDSILGARPVSEWNYEEDSPKLFGSMCGAVMNEELRLIPPVGGIPKSTPAGAPQILQIGGRPVMIPAAAYVTLNTAAVHRNPKYWPHTSAEDLLTFRPERWLLDPNKANSNTDADAYEAEEDLDFDGPDKRPDTAASLFRPRKGAYIPFSEGCRSCLGRRFAQVEILAVLAVIFKTWTVELDVSMFLSDEDYARASEEEKRAAWEKAADRVKGLLKHGMGTLITIQMRKGKVPFRLVRRGSERFAFMYA